MLRILGKSTQIKIETGIVSGSSIFKIKLSNLVGIAVELEALSNFYVAEPNYEGSPRTIGSLLEKSTQTKKETGVVSGPSIFEIYLSDFVVVRVNNQTPGSPIPML